jgi:hypothetical protein
MRRVGLSLLGLLVGYGGGVAAGFALVTLASPNTHDRSVEAAMTAFFVTGPMGAILGLAIALLMSRKKTVQAG